MSLNARQQIFVKEYLIDLNATQAAIRAGYSEKTAAEQASRLLTNVKIKAAVQEGVNSRAAKLDTSAEKVIEDLGILRDMCMGRLPVNRTILTDDGDGGKIPVEVNTTVFDPSGAKGAIELLGKHHKMFSDRVEIVNKTDLQERLQRARERIAKR